MRKRKDRDRPRPSNSSAQCLARLKDGEHHALVDLLEALKREKDPRFWPLFQEVKEAMDRMAQMDVAQAKIMEWGRAQLFAIRLMSPAYGDAFQNVIDAVGTPEEPP